MFVSFRLLIAFIFHFCTCSVLFSFRCRRHDPSIRRSAAPSTRSSRGLQPRPQGYFCSSRTPNTEVKARLPTACGAVHSESRAGQIAKEYYSRRIVAVLGAKVETDRKEHPWDGTVRRGRKPRPRGRVRGDSLIKVLARYAYFQNILEKIFD